MDHYTRFSARASLVAVGQYMRQQGIWQTVETHVQIPQKVRVYEPLTKLKVALLDILTGGHGLVEVNTRVRPDEALLRTFDIRAAAAPAAIRCPDQSVVSTTVNACTKETVATMHQALQALQRQQSRSYRHDYAAQVQVLDVDITGLLAGLQAEEATKGYFAGKKGRRGRQVGRVLATRYDEIVVDRLYPGKRQLERSLQDLVRAAEMVLGLSPEQRARTVIRFDGGGGRDADINWLLDHGYPFLGKVKNWQRAHKLAATVSRWQQDPHGDREFGWVETPHPYHQPTRQLAVRAPTDDGGWHEWVLVFQLADAQLFELGRQPVRTTPTPDQVAWAALAAYDLRGGGVETANKGSKSGLGLDHRSKQKFAAQEMLVALAQLAYNLLTWMRAVLAHRTPYLQHYGPLRLVRDVLQIPGKVVFDAYGHVVQIILSQAHIHALAVRRALAPYLARDGTALILDKI